MKELTIFQVVMSRVVSVSSFIPFEYGPNAAEILSD